MFRRQHILWWTGLYLVWIMVFQKRSFALSSTATIEFCYLIFIAANFYYNTIYIVPRFLYKQKHLEYIFLFTCGVLITALLRVPLAAYLNEHYFLVDQPQPTLSAIFIASVLNIFIWTVILVAGKIAIDRYRFQLYVDEMEKAKAQAELDFLNAQLNPHFLFNSLNSIYGHIDKRNTEARNMLLTFSEMLRFQLYTSNKNEIPIDEEIDYLRNYVALQKTRKDDRFKISFEVASTVKGFSVAPLLFIAFVENAFKYASAHEEKENRIDISFEKNDSTLVFKCYNSKELNGQSAKSHRGIGIDNTKRRLALHYKDKHELKITNDSSFYQVDLKIELS